MRFSIGAAVLGAVWAGLILPDRAGAAELMAAPADIAKFAPSSPYLVTEPLPAKNVAKAAIAADNQETEDANPEYSPLVVACDAVAADPDDATRPEGVAGVALTALDVARAVEACGRAHDRFAEHPRTAYNYGRAEMAQGGFDPAISAFAVAADAGHPLAALTLAELYSGGVLPDRSTADAVPYYETAAEAGFVQAQMVLGRLFSDGAPGVETDPAASARWFRAAAASGEPEAAFEMGWAFENGIGVPQDPITAARWYTRAQAAGHTGAINNLGWLYANGTGVPRDEERAVALYREAANAGIAAAMSNLGWALENGIGTEQNVSEAAQWYVQAAGLGETQAMLNLGWLYLTGHDVAADPAAALEWFKQAEAGGRSEALSYIGEVYETDPSLRNPAEAARYYIRALAAGDAWPARRAAADWDGEMALEMQNALASAGVYAGPFDGAIGESTQAAMAALLAQSSQGS